MSGAIVLTNYNDKTRECNLLIVLDTESYDAMKTRDPYGLDIGEVTRPGSIIASVGMVWGDEADRAEIVRLSREGKHHEAWNHACRGHVCRPDDGQRPVDLLKGD